MTVTQTFREPVFYVHGSAWLVDIAREQDGVLVANNTGETIAQLALRHPGVCVIELDDAILRTQQSVQLPAVEITADAFNAAAACLPPNHWRDIGGAESFKCPERVVGRITSIYARIGARHFHLRDDFDLPHSEIVKRCRNCMGASA